MSVLCSNLTNFSFCDCYNELFIKCSSSMHGWAWSLITESCRNKSIAWRTRRVEEQRRNICRRAETAMAQVYSDECMHTRTLFSADVNHRVWVFNRNSFWSDRKNIAHANVATDAVDYYFCSTLGEYSWYSPQWSNSEHSPLWEPLWFLHLRSSGLEPAPLGRTTPSRRNLSVRCPVWCHCSWQERACRSPGQSEESNKYLILHDICYST